MMGVQPQGCVEKLELSRGQKFSNAHSYIPSDRAPVLTRSKSHLRDELPVDSDRRVPCGVSGD
jgi:hypothetical protein